MTALLILLVLVAGFALVQRRRLFAILGMSVFSLLLSAVFLLASAPDVAITEAAIGAALGTFVYVLAIRKTGRLMVAANDVPGLLHEETGVLSGFEVDVLRRVAAASGLELVVGLMSRDEVEDAVRRGEADVAAGGIVESPDAQPDLLATEPHLATAQFTVRTPSAQGPSAIFRGEVGDLIDAVRGGDEVAVDLDLARLLALSRATPRQLEVARRDGTAGYVFLVAGERGDLLQRVNAEIDRMRRAGELDEIARRHLS
ncbi:MAG: hydrogenase subunit MbhD domain-containing protein [Candidatus Bipolaricaulota bacterium]